MYEIRSHTLYLTNACMLHCPYCYEKKSREKFGLIKMTWEEIKSIIDNAIYLTPTGPLEFSLFGGEPTFFLKEQVIPILRYLKSFQDHQRFKITLMTNGFNLTEEFVKEAEGLDWFALISLDGDYQMVQDSMSEKSYERILKNIKAVPIEVRQLRLGLKATISDSAAKKSRRIYDLLRSLQTGVIYISPTHEIDKCRIRDIIAGLGNDISLIRDAQLLRGDIKINSGAELFYKKGEIFALGHTYRMPDTRPIGWFGNGKVMISNLLLTQLFEKYPGLSNGKMYLTPYDLNKCCKCALNGKICIPNTELQTNHLAQTQCLWYKEIEEALCSIQKD